jgi:hypothetical protein
MLILITSRNHPDDLLSLCLVKTLKIINPILYNLILDDLKKLEKIG